jgi:hypothetical protein
MSVTEEELKQMLAERTNPEDPFSRMEYKPRPGKSKTLREIKTPDGETIYIEDREITLNPYSGQQEHRIIQITKRCESCGMPITAEMLALDEVKPCINPNCRKITCPRCRVNTNLHEYLRPEIRGQPLCQICYSTHFRNVIMMCPSCHQAAKDPYDVKLCVQCNRTTCPSCGVPIEGGGMLCGSCYEVRERQRHASEAVDTIFRDLLEVIL